MAQQASIARDVLHRQAQVAVQAGLLNGEDVDALLDAVPPSDVPGWFAPDVAVLAATDAQQRLVPPTRRTRLRLRDHLRRLRLLPDHHRLPRHPASQHDAAASKGQDGRAELFQKLLDSPAARATG